MAKRAQPSATHRLNLHDTYGVRWTPEMIARDLVQNYYDSVAPADFAEQIHVSANVDAHHVEVKGPGTFDVQLLWRIGLTTKSEEPGRYAGGFGEGFALAILQILRAKADTVAAVQVGGDLVNFRLDDVSVGEVLARELVCDVKQVRPIRGSKLTLANCDSELASAFSAAKNHFFYPGHPLLGDRLDWLGEEDPDEEEEQWDPDETSHAVYRSAGPAGAVFYRRQLRAHLNVPLIFCCHEPTKGINPGRDRLNLNAREVKKVFSACSEYLPPEAVAYIVLELLKPYWADGHPLLNVLADYWFGEGFYDLDPIKFPPEYVAASGDYVDTKIARDQGKKVCPGYMSLFGMQTTEEIAGFSKQAAYRPPVTPLPGVSLASTPGAMPAQTGGETTVDENEAFSILKDALLAISGLKEFHYQPVVFVPTEYEQEPRLLRVPGVICLSRDAFEGSLGGALAEFAYQAYNNFNRDGESIFTDALTELIEAVAREPERLNLHEERWAAMRDKRGRQPAPSAYLSAIEQLCNEGVPASLLQDVREIARAGLAAAGLCPDSPPGSGPEPPWYQAAHEIRASAPPADTEAASGLLTAWADAAYAESPLTSRSYLYQWLPADDLAAFCNGTPTERSSLPGAGAEQTAAAAELNPKLKRAYAAAFLLDHSNQDALVNLVERCVWLPDDRPTLLELLAAGFTEPQDAARAYRLAAILALKVNDFDEASAGFAAASAIFPHDESLALEMSLVPLRRGGWLEAGPHILRAVDMARDHLSQGPVFLAPGARIFLSPQFRTWCEKVCNTPPPPHGRNLLRARAARAILLYFLKSQEHGFFHEYAVAVSDLLLSGRSTKQIHQALLDEATAVLELVPHAGEMLSNAIDGIARIE